MRTKKYALQGTYAGEKRGEGPLYFALFALCETENGGTTKFERYRDDLVRMMGEGVAKKEMARRTGLSVPTVRKYLKMIE